MTTLALVGADAPAASAPTDLPTLDAAAVLAVLGDIIEAVSHLTDVTTRLVDDQAATSAAVDALATDARALADAAQSVMGKMSTGGLMGMLMGR